MARRCRAFFGVTATGYALGIDLGTTSTAAAVQRGANANAAIFLLGSHGATIPSLVFMRDDQVLLTGEAAERRGIVEPTRLARALKRRVGDSTPILLGHAAYPAERLMAALLRDVAAAVATREGADPDRVAVSHPANWGPGKVDLLRHALDLAGLRSATLLTEPVAAAVHHAANQRVEPGSVVAVYDLGGGTFDAAVLRLTRVAGPAATFETLGEPEGIDRLGGIDLDEAVFAHVRHELHGKVEELDGSDRSVQVALGHLRRECVGAKEALSSDTETTIAVALPNVHTDIRLTRAELEPMILPAIAETVEALRRAVERAGVHPHDLDSVLLAGGSAHIPLVARMVSSALGRPVAVGAHPKHPVALGAAMVAAAVAAGASSISTTTSMTSPNPSPTMSDPPAGGDGARGGPGGAADAPALPGQVLRTATPPPPGRRSGDGHGRPGMAATQGRWWRVGRRA